MRVRAYLDGHSFGLEALARIFASGDPHVMCENGQYQFQATELDDAPGGDLHRRAGDVLRRMNGAARAFDDRYRSVRLAGRYSDELGRQQQVVTTGIAEARGHASAVVVAIGGVPVEPPPPPGPGVYQLAKDNPDVAEALHILGNGDPAVSWFDLYKVYEIIGGKNTIVAAGWATKDELSTFTESANRKEASGDAARHARLKGEWSQRTMSNAEERSFITGVFRNGLSRYSGQIW